ncbi:MAG: hypothetical protein ACM3X1_04855 [Ignavibacteriales bacterium]
MENKAIPLWSYILKLLQLDVDSNPFSIPSGVSSTAFMETKGIVLLSLYSLIGPSSAALFKKV